MVDDDEVRLEIVGPATIVGFGNAASANDAPYTTSIHRTFRGRALAILRSTGEEGEVSINATSLRHCSAVAVVHARTDSHLAGDVNVK